MVIFREEKEDGRIVEHLDSDWLIVKTPRPDDYAGAFRYSIYRPV